MFIFIFIFIFIFFFVSKVFYYIDYDFIECRTVEHGGNRIYNVVLNSMQSYPVTDILEIVYGVGTL